MGLGLFKYAVADVLWLEDALRLWVCGRAYPECGSRLEALKQYDSLNGAGKSISERIFLLMMNKKALKGC